MNVFEYITLTNQDAAADLCSNYGFQPENVDDLPVMLQDIATNDGEQGFRDVMSLHPDRQILISRFGYQSEKRYGHMDGANNIGCQNCQKCQQLQKMLKRDMNGRNASGEGSNMTNSVPISHDKTILTAGLIGLGVIAIYVITR